MDDAARATPRWHEAARWRVWWGRPGLAPTAAVWWGVAAPATAGRRRTHMASRGRSQVLVSNRADPSSVEQRELIIAELPPHGQPWLQCCCCSCSSEPFVLLLFVLLLLLLLMLSLLLL